MHTHTHAQYPLHACTWVSNSGNIYASKHPLPLATCAFKLERGGREVDRQVGVKGGENGEEDREETVEYN